MIEEKDFSHGLAISKLFLALSKNENFFSLILNEKNSSKYTLKIKKNKKNSLFKLREEFYKIGLYIKISNQRKSPWSYTFTKKHQEDIDKSFKENDTTFIILVNSNDGIVSLEYEEFRQLLDYNHEEAERVSVFRKHNQSYRLSGRDGKFERTLRSNDFPKKIVNHIKNL